MGRIQPDLVLKNVQLVNVFTNEIYPADVAIAEGYIAGVGQYSGENEVDCQGNYLCPGFIDAHIHIESTMALPAQLGRAVVVSGTTTLIADPHELVNVCGAQGVRFLLDASESAPVNVYLMLPSSVPATPFETNGAPFTAEDMKQLVKHPRVLGLGEVMCYTDVLAKGDEVFKKIALFEGGNIDGHAPGLSGRELQAYGAAGVATEHECTTFKEAAEKARAGLSILVREGSAAKNLQALVRGLIESKMPADRFLFCTDDKHLDDIQRDGHIRWNIKRAIEEGLDPVTAIKMATIYAARAYGLKDLGAVAPGYRADLVLLSDLQQMKVEAVYKDGEPIQQRLSRVESVPVPAALKNTVHCDILTKEKIALAAHENDHVIEMIPSQLVTNHLYEPIPQRDGVFVPDSEYTKLCVVERHGKNGNIAVAPLKGYHISGGAIATSVAHDSHNIIVAGDNDADIVLAVNHLREIGGGYVLVKNGQVEGDLPLPVGGLMSDAPFEEIQQRTSEILAKAKGMGIPQQIDPFISLSFMTLPVIPTIRLTDKGLFDVTTFSMINK